MGRLLLAFSGDGVARTIDLASPRSRDSIALSLPKMSYVSWNLRRLITDLVKWRLQPP